MPHNRILLMLFWSAAPLLAQNDAGTNDSGEDTARPVMAWRFDDQKHAGPRPPVYPGFGAGNMAGQSDGKSAVLVVKGDDRVLGKPLRFGLKDSITLEAWVKVGQIGEGNLVYILGKGRTKGDTKNQNYALRLKGARDGAKISFLFASAQSDGQAAGWHRWTSDNGFGLAGWHHVAVTYTFGDAKSIRGYIDGKTTKGTWDMDGATDRAPASDEDDLVLGTGNGGGKSNSFVGYMDEVTIWRTALPEALLASRYQVVPPAPVVKREEIPRGKVLVQICEEGMPRTNSWPDEPLKASESYTEEAFGFFEEPHKYVDTGVRGDRANPHLFRAAGLVTLPAGKHRLLLRGRGAARLYIDGKAVLSNPFPPADTGGHGHVSDQEKFLDLGPEFRFRPPGNRESWCEFEADGKEHWVVLETIVGGYAGSNRRRPELGETVIAWSKAGSLSWELLTPTDRTIPYTDEGWARYEDQGKQLFERTNAQARAARRLDNAAYWQKRRELARDYLAKTAEVEIPELAQGFSAGNAIDHFVAAKIAAAQLQVAQAKRGTVDFYGQVQPILEAKCFDCHQGGKAKGNLKLDERAAMLKGGKSGKAALTPGNPQESALVERVVTEDEDEIMPPKGQRLTAQQVELIKTWIKEGAHWPELRTGAINVTPLADDLTFLRRLTLDTIGIVPTLEEIEAFVKDSSPNKRAAMIETRLADPRWADHWMGYWQDALAENPNILNPTLNNTGPFRWWIYESLIDNKPMDLFVTELVRMKGSERFGGPAGFGVASQNDAPMAAKGTIISSAFLGVEMKCARCHDAPAHQSTQGELFQLAAMLSGKAVTVPATSSVPMDRIHQGGRKPLIQVTLKPGAKLEPVWPFAQFCDPALAMKLAEHGDDPRDVLAAAITAPQNERFAQVIANRVWKRFMGRGLIDPVEDWEKGKVTHPELLKWLGRELVQSGYDLKHLARLILNSHAYQRATDPGLSQPSVVYAAPAARRLEAEQIVDSLFAATGKPLKTEEVSLDIDGSRDLGNSISLGRPRRAWMLTSTSNERDRPSLSLPRIQAVADVLEAFGWRGARQDPTSRRENAPNTLQPAILGNGIMGTWLTTLSEDHGVTQLVLQDRAVEEMVDLLFLKLLTRRPTADEKKHYVDFLREGYEQRVVVSPPARATMARRPGFYVSWSNHLDPPATTLRQQEEADARRGDPPTARLNEAWRKKMEDVLWSMLNAPQWVFTP